MTKAPPPGANAIQMTLTLLVGMVPAVLVTEAETVSVPVATPT